MTRKGGLGKAIPTALPGTAAMKAALEQEAALRSAEGWTTATAKIPGITDIPGQALWLS